ncbi:hypothetical protein AM501_24880 [Aneurinibacillus migulanus]|uniref:hypothetical protein n=1 Tax=Aneurinibacillus migulanus TaxID=47500 RepID=UPI0005B94906|nr:hypothetical protein [Aneurinibacillus migulanus]KIV58372.1 hypothetical protein TS64_04750 [Aneurinibacillus migulanus]KPD05683.1 hypothetical protein AM501_24880 [Aneurinibacillus migulanus]
MKRKITTLAFAIVLSFSTIALAAINYPYGDYKYGEKNVAFKGNLEPSGLGVEQRPSHVNRHDLRLHNVNDNTHNPENGYLQTVQYDIQPLPGEPPNKFSEKSGYHVLPLDQELIKDLAKKANGNPEYVWNQVSQHAQQAQSSPSMKSGKVEFYTVDYVPYVNISSVIYYSGGGDPDMVRVKDGNGISSPLFQTTYKTTNWPVINELKQEGQGLRIKATGYSVFDTAVSGKIVVNNDPSTTKQIFSKNTDVKNYGVTFDGVVPFTQLSGLKQGENTITLTVTDAFGRSVPDKTITVIVGQQKQPNLILTKMEVSPAIPKRKGQAKITVWVKNDSTQSYVSPLILQLDGKKVGEQKVGLPAGEEKKFVFTAIMPDAPQTVARATVNPNKNEPAKELTYDDNYKEITIPLDPNNLLGKLNLILAWNKGPTKVQHAGQFVSDVDTDTEYRAYYKNPNTYSVVVSAYNDSKNPVTTTLKMTNTYYYSVYVIPKPPKCSGECTPEPPPPPYWSIQSDVQEEEKTITIPARDEVFVTFSGIRPSYTHTTEKDEKGNPKEEPFNNPKFDTTHKLYFILNERQNPVEQTYEDNTINRTIQVNNKGVLERKGILVE